MTLAEAYRQGFEAAKHGVPYGNPYEPSAIPVSAHYVRENIVWAELGEKVALAWDVIKCECQTPWRHSNPA